MGKMAESKTNQVYLEVSMGIEGLCAGLYHHYGSICEDIPEAACLWKKTALEEENHQKQFGLALHLLHEIHLEILAGSLNRAHSIHYKLLKLMDHIKSNKPDLLTAVVKAIEMERNLADLHAHSSLNCKDDSLQRLFKSLSEADGDHVSDLLRYRTILSLPYSEMDG